MQWVLTVAALLAAIGTAIGTVILAIATTRSVQKQKDAILANILLDFRKEYNDRVVGESMQRLSKWKKNQGTEFVGKLLEKLKAGYDCAAKLQIDVRRISLLFQRITALRKADLVDDVFVKTALNPYMAAFFLDIIWPLDKALSPEHEEWPFLLVSGLYTDEELRLPRQQWT